ncbi:MAG: iron uptake porin [Leptolyngbyaceae cyanobacterium RU_5_1]|nr:iron uptake porin [Leptolyngbyaceae cyanobacterium RU_5_1]
MSRILLKSLLVSPAILGAALAVSSPAIAADSIAAEIAAVDSIAAETVENNVTVEAHTLISEPQVLAPTLEAPTLEAPVPVLEFASEQKLAQALPTTSGSSDTSSLEQINRYTREGRSNNQGQVTSVSQFSDVRPTDWAFQALQSLVERYGCIVGYPDKTYRGNRATTRYEFAAGLNACLDKIQELIAAATADFVRKEDLEVMKKLQEEFAAELAVLRGRVDALEVRTATLEKQQFSTTTKLSGEVIFAITDEFQQPGDNETVFQDRVRLTLNSSFGGEDKLIVRLAAGNAEPFRNFGVNGAPLLEGFQTFNFGRTENNSVVVDWVAYEFPIGENIKVYVPAYGGLHYDYAPTHAGYLEDYDGGNGALSYFAQRNPIYDIGGGSGIGVTLGVGKPISLSIGYLADNGDGDNGILGANIPSRGAGLFDGSYSALAQINFTPNDKFSVGLAYVNAFRKAGVFDGGGGAPATGTIFSNPLTAFAIAGIGITGPQGVVVNGGGISAVYKFSDKFAINAFGSYFRADILTDGLGDDDIWTYGLGLSFPDFGKKGNLLGLFAGTPPYLNDDALDTPIHIEAFYRIRLNDNISITPGAIYVINGDQISGEDTLIGTIRTTFTF